MLIYAHHVEHQLLNQSMNTPAEVQFYAPEQVCGPYLREYDWPIKTALEEPNQPLLTLGVNTNWLGEVGGGDSYHLGGFRSPVQSRPVQPLYQDTEIDGGAIGVSTQQCKSICESFREPNHKFCPFTMLRQPQRPSSLPRLRRGSNRGSQPRSSSLGQRSRQHSQVAPILVAHSTQGESLSDPWVRDWGWDL